GLPTDTLLSADVALAGAEIDRVPNVNKSPTTMLTRRTVIRFSFRGDWRRSDWRKGYPFARARKPDRMRFSRRKRGVGDGGLETCATNPFPLARQTTVAFLLRLLDVTHHRRAEVGIGV